jgi:hypothetical protein
MFQTSEKNTLFPWRFPPPEVGGGIRRMQRAGQHKWEQSVALDANKMKVALQSVLIMLAINQ